MFKFRYTLLVLLVVLAMAVSACTGDEEPAELEKISLPMGFIADPQYAPFYVAASKGYFEEAGYEVEFDYSFETDGMALVGANERPFAIVSGDQVILARAQELPVVFVLEWFQKYPIVVVSKAEAGIETPADLVGRELGLPGFFGATYVGYVGLLNANGIEQTDVTATEIGFTQVEQLSSDAVEAVAGYANNEPLQLQNLGEDVNVLYVSDYVDMVANGIITNESMIAENPDRVQAFVTAVLRGLADTLNDPDEAFTISRDFVEGLEDDRRPVLDASLPLWSADMLGETDAGSWTETQAVLLSMGFLDEPVATLDEAYTNTFIEAGQP